MHDRTYTIAAMKKPVVKYLLIAVVIVSALAVVAGLQLAWKPAIPPALQGMGDDFSLHSDKGTVSLRDFRGKVTLVYFGYTHCPDVCPMALGVMGSAMQALPKDEGRRVAGVFISLDPRRDTPKVLAAYTDFFDSRIIGLTGSPDELARVADAWRVGYSVPDAPADANYAVEHSTFIYLVNPEGKVAALFDEQSNPDDIATAIRRWLD